MLHGPSSISLSSVSQSDFSGLHSTIRASELERIRAQIHGYLEERPYDFYDTFVLGSGDADATEITALRASVTLRCRGYKTRSRKFAMRAEFTAFLVDLFEEMALEVV